MTKVAGVAVAALMITLGGQRIPSLHADRAATLPNVHALARFTGGSAELLMSVILLADTSPVAEAGKRAPAAILRTRV